MLCVGAGSALSRHALAPSCSVQGHFPYWNSRRPPYPIAYLPFPPPKNSPCIGLGEWGWRRVCYCTNGEFPKKPYGGFSPWGKPWEFSCGEAPICQCACPRKGANKETEEKSLCGDTDLKHGTNQCRQCPERALLCLCQGWLIHSGPAPTFHIFIQMDRVSKAHSAFQLVLKRAKCYTLRKCLLEITSPLFWGWNTLCFVRFL